MYVKLSKRTKTGWDVLTMIQMQDGKVVTSGVVDEGLQEMLEFEHSGFKDLNPQSTDADFLRHLPQAFVGSSYVAAKFIEE